MKIVGLPIVLCLVFCMTYSTSFAGGDAKRGKVLFNESGFAGGIKSCSSCHPGGSGLEQAAGRKEFHIMGKTQKTLEEAVNACIVYAIQGKAIKPKSPEMQDLVAFINSLKSK